MNPDTLIRMANQIADALAVTPDPEQAAADLAGHLTRFWEPRMRAALLAAADDPPQRAHLSPRVIRALARIRAPG